MKRRKSSPFPIAVIIWAIAVVVVLWLAVKYPRVVYVEVPSAPQTVVVEREVVVKEDPYYAKIAESVTDKEINLLAKLAYEEAGNQSPVGQRAVIEVVLNRVMSDQFPNTIEEVIYQDDPTQFIPAYRLASTTPTEKQYEAVWATLDCTVPILPEDVLFFSTSLNGRTGYEKIGDHYFCY